MHHIPAFSLATKISGLTCPRCSSNAYHKSGRKLGIQRYCCTQCGRTFNETVNTPFHGIHDKQKMQEYLLTMQEQQSVRSASRNIGISVPTSFSWRHRILASLRMQSPSAGTSPAGICEIVLKHSFKGKRNVQSKQMPDTHSLLISDVRGTPNLQLLVAKKKTIEAALLVTNTLHPAAQIQVVGTNLLTRVARKISSRLVQNRLESHSLAQHAGCEACKLSGWMARFNGVATKYLQQYWNWFRAESNLLDFDRFRAECFGHRQLAYYRQLSAA